MNRRRRSSPPFDEQVRGRGARSPRGGTGPERAVTRAQRQAGAGGHERPLFPICRTPFPPYVRNQFFFLGARGVAAARVPRERWRGGEATLLGASCGAHPAPPPFPAPCWRAAPMGRAAGDGGRRRRSRWVAQSPLGRRWVFSECADECILRDGACEIWELGAAQGA